MLHRLWMRRSAFRLLVLFCGGCALVLLLNSYRLSVSPLDLQATDHGSLAALQSRIVELSRDYVSKLAKEQALVDDGPYFGSVSSGTTFYDLKKTLAVLLESMLRRVDRLEASLALLRLNQVDNSTGAYDQLLLDQILLEKRLAIQAASSNASSIARPVSIIDLWNNAQEKCELSPEFRYRFPTCYAKIKWLETFWHSDPCYAANGVDGTLCSFRIYLSEVEHHCPRLPWRSQRPSRIGKQFVPLTERPPAMEDLFRLMNDDKKNYEWMAGRIGWLWPKWLEAHRWYHRNTSASSVRRIRRRILLHIGCLTKESNFNFGKLASKGGPLGELVQWSDLITSLFILGHNITISSQTGTMIKLLKEDPSLKSGCPLQQPDGFDVIFTDIVGLRQIKKRISGFQHLQCKLRILDSFGTQAEFNSKHYFNTHIKARDHKQSNYWGGLELNLQQFYTLFPHRQDNSFLGFVVVSESVCRPSDSCGLLKKENIGLVYGKEAYMWKDTSQYLTNVKDLVEIHGTVHKDKVFKIPDFVINHGVVNGSEYAQLLRRSRILFGLGFPYEGPTPLEAVAHGVVFINPKFKVPKGRRTERFFADKPTLRELSSQNPYTEDFIGEPYVLTVDISNVTAFRAAVEKALTTELKPFIPYEFTNEGMLQRIGAYMEYQDFCTETVHWPPFSSAQIIVADSSESCTDACWKKGFVCEYSYFSKINLPSILQKYSPCKHLRELPVHDARWETSNLPV